MFPEDIVDVANIGIHPTNTGAANNAAARAAQLALPAGRSQRWFFSGGEYNFDDTFHIIRPIWLEGIGGGWNLPRTVFKFPAGKHGLWVHHPPGHNAAGAAASNIHLTALGKTTVSHGVVIKGHCFLSHILITGFRGDGINADASLPASSASLSKFDCVQVSTNGDSVGIASLARTGRNLAITTSSPHNLAVDDVFWLESANVEADFPRAVCGVTGVGSEITLQADHPLETLLGSATATREYRVVIGHGIYTHGDDAASMICIGCNFSGNTGWGVLEDARGNTYVGCLTDSNQVGAYYADNPIGFGNVFLACHAEQSQNTSVIGYPAVVLGGNHAAGLSGTGLFLIAETSTQLAFKNGSGGSVTLGHRDQDSTRYMTFNNAIDGIGSHLSVDFDKSVIHKRMLGFGNFANIPFPAFLITGPNSIHSQWPMALGPSQLVVNRRLWLDMTRHETVFRRPDDVTHPNDTWNQGDRAWNRDVAPGGTEGWICTRGGTIGDYSEGRTATANGTTTVVMNSPSDVLKIGMYLLINGERVRPVEINGATMTMDFGVPAGVPGLPIAYSPPVFNKFGSISVQSDPDDQPAPD